MATLYLVRHGKAAAGWDADHDPGLDATGQAQAEAVAKTLEPLGPLQMVTSPMRRCQETSVPLSTLWGRTPTIEKGVSEVPSPLDDLVERTAWLRGFMSGSWGDADAERQAWRMNVVRALLDLPQDTVVFTHFIAINAAVGEATRDDRVVSFRPDNCSVTVMRSVMDELQLVERGQEAQTEVR
ncbi:MAG: histidine phosphatase family protein [Alphaproteobacteria bacterium]